MTDRADSSHKNVGNVKAELYFAWCEGDPTAPISDLETLHAALRQAGVRHRIEIYSAQHGFAPPGGPRYDRAASERHWERVLALFHRNLGT